MNDTCKLNSKNTVIVLLENKIEGGKSKTEFSFYIPLVQKIHKLIGK